MEKVRKFFEWLWYGKERVVLAIMVLVLCWNVYRVMYPVPAEAPPVHKAPGQPESAEGAGMVGPEPAQVSDWKAVYTPNPFWYFSGLSSSQGNNKQEEDAGISLVSIKEVGGKYRARLQTESTTRWYDEGEQFESFELLSIDPDAQTCLVRSERLGKDITLKVAGN